VNVAGSEIAALTLLDAIAVCAGSGVPGFLLRPSRSGHGDQRLAAVLCALGSVLGLTVALRTLAGKGGFRVALAGPLGAPIVFELDALGAAFLLPPFVLSALGAIYGLGYWPQREKARSSRKLGLAWGVLTASMALVAVARTGIVFLLAWELMALAAFFLQQGRPPLYLVYVFVTVLALLAWAALRQKLLG
jgi:hydrogenase-4 component B